MSEFTGNIRNCGLFLPCFRCSPPPLLPSSCYSLTGPPLPGNEQPASSFNRGQQKLAINTHDKYCVYHPNNATYDDIPLSRTLRDFQSPYLSTRIPADRAASTPRFQKFLYYPTVRAILLRVLVHLHLAFALYFKPPRENLRQTCPSLSHSENISIITKRWNESATLVR